MFDTHLFGGSTKGNFLASSRPMATIWRTVASRGTRWISGVEYSAKAA